MKENEKDNEKKKKLYAIIAIVVLIALIIAGTIWLIVSKNNSNNEEDKPEIAYTELIKMIEDGQIEKIEMTTGSQSIKVKVKDVEEEKTAIVPSIQPFVELVQEKEEKNNNGEQPEGSEA